MGENADPTCTSEGDVGNPEQIAAPPDDHAICAAETADMEVAGAGSDDDAPEGGPSDSEPSDLGSEEDQDSDNGCDIDGTLEDAEVLLDDLSAVQSNLAVSQAQLPAAAPVRPKEYKEVNWTGCPAPGVPGFNRFATEALRSTGVDKPGANVGGLLPHQVAVAVLLHPNSPIKRLLVDHPTGSGKTREMISVLDNFFYDPRPKIPIFPKESVCRNFYFELLKWPSKYRDFFSCLQPKAAKAASGVDDWRTRREQTWDVSHLKERQVGRLCQIIRDALEMKAAFIQGRMRKTVRDEFERRFPGEPFLTAPLRALRYTSAGGGSIRIRSGMPVSTLFKIGFDQKSRNVYTNKVVVMDEVHNLVRSKTRYLRQLDKLRELLFAASNVVLAGFTGTPILSEPDEGRRLLGIIKGSSAPAGDEGYLASFQMRPLSMYPRSVPKGMPDAVLTKPLVSQFVHRVVLHGEMLKTFDMKLKGGYSGTKLTTYCNVYAHPSSFHGGKSGTRTKVLGSPEECAPKLLAIAREIALNPGKALVLISKSQGYRPMLALMKQVAKAHRPSFEVATMEQLSQFNDPVKNLRGDAFKVMVADAAQCAEGVSFLSVRRVFLAEVPTSPSSLIQLCSRALRMYGHRWLPTEEQEVRFFLYVSQMPHWLQTPLGAWALRVQPKSVEGRTMEMRARHFLGCLQRAGVTCLDELKQYLEAHVRSKAKRNKTLETEDVFGTLVQLGLWNEVKRIWEAEYEEQLSDGNEDALLPMKAGAGTSGTAAQPKARPGQALVQEMQNLFKAKDLSAYQRTLSFETADEAALRHLVRMTAAFAPALADLRSRAVDSEVLRTCYDGKLEDESGDDIVLTFEGDAFMVPSGTDAAVGRLFNLPSGWKVEQPAQVDKALPATFFITDPSGKHFTTSKDAMHAISLLEAKRRALERGQRPGLKIIVHMSETRPDLNGQRGTIVQWDESEGQWEVDILDAGSTLVSPEHLKADETPEMPPAADDELTLEATGALSAMALEDECPEQMDGDMGDSAIMETAEATGEAVEQPEANVETASDSAEGSKADAQPNETENTDVAPSREIPEVVILDEEVVDYFRDKDDELPQASSANPSQDAEVGNKVAEIDLTHDISDYFRSPSKVDVPAPPKPQGSAAQSTSAKPPERPSLQPSSAAEVRPQLADFFRLPEKTSTPSLAKPPAQSFTGASAHQSTAAKPPERLSLQSSAAAPVKPQLADFFRTPEKTSKPSPPKPPARLPENTSKTSPPKPPASNALLTIDLTNELADFFRFVGAPSQKSSVSGPPQQDGHRSRSNPPQSAAPSHKSRKLAASLPSPVKASSQAAASISTSPSEQSSILRPVRQEGTGSGSSGAQQVQRALPSSTKRKLAFSLPGLLKASGQESAQVMPDQKRQKQLARGSEKPSAAALGMATSGQTKGSSLDRSSADAGQKQTASPIAQPACPGSDFKSSADALQRQSASKIIQPVRAGTAHDPAVASVHAGAAHDPSVASGDAAGLKSPVSKTQSNPLIDVIDLIDLDDATDRKSVV